MPRTPTNERVVVLQTDGRGNILDYGVVNRPDRSYVIKKRAQTDRSEPRGQPQYREEAYEDDEYYDDEGNISAATEPIRRARRDIDDPSGNRRVRYVRPKSTVKIFQEKVDWAANSKVDTRNDQAMEKILNAPKKKIHDQRVEWRGRTKVDTHNEDTVENMLRAPKPAIFIDKPTWRAQPKIDTHNEEAVETFRRAPKPQIYEEALRWKAGPKIDSHNEEVIERLKSAPKPAIFDEKFTWQATPRIDHQNDDYVKHKERARALRHERNVVPVYSQEQRPTKQRPRIDHLNPDYDEYRKRKRSARLPPIEDRKLEWQKVARVNQKNEDYIERLRQKRSVPVIFQEKVHWNAKTPRIDAHNGTYLDNIRYQQRPKIFSEPLRWKGEPKIDSFNDTYDPDSYIPPMIVNEKLRWHARPKIDTGLEPDPDDQQFADYGVPA